MARCALDAEKVVRELSTIAFSSLLNYEFDDQGFVTIVEDGPPEAIKALASMRRKRIVTEHRIEIFTSEIRLWDKPRALELLGKKLRLWDKKGEGENPQGEAYRLPLKQLKEEPTAQ